MAPLKGHTGSTGRVSAVQGRWHPLILSARSQLAGLSLSCIGSLVSSASSLVCACRGSINLHILAAGNRLRDAVERSKSALWGFIPQYFWGSASVPLVLNAFRRWSWSYLTVKLGKTVNINVTKSCVFLSSFLNTFLFSMHMVFQVVKQDILTCFNQPIKKNLLFLLLL